MKNLELARIFSEMADILEIKGDNPFKIRAYRRAALNLEGESKGVETLSREELREIPGIGGELATKIEEYCATGIVHAHEKLKSEIPSGLLELLAIPGLGPKTAKLLFEKAGVSDLGGLELAAGAGRLAGLPGVGEKTVENILKGIATVRRGRDRRPLGLVLPMALEIVDELKKRTRVERIELAGSIRRRRETVKDIDIVATAQEPEHVMDAFIRLPAVTDVVMHGPTRSSVTIRDGINVDIRVVPRDSYGAALAYLTGSKGHNIRIRDMAVRKGFKVNEYGIFREVDDERSAARMRRTSTASSVSPLSRRSCGRTWERWRRPWRGNSRSLLPWARSGATSTSTPRGAMAPIPLGNWLPRHRRGASPTWPSPTTPMGSG